MISDAGLDTLFRTARSQNGWATKPVSDEQLHDLYELMKWGPTSANCSPARILFLRTQAAKDKLRPFLSAGNVAKTDAAPVTAVIGYDTGFHRHLPRLFPHNPSIKDNFRGPEHAAHCEQTAFRNGTLQGGYFMLAARALGLDCGPMSGFDAQAIDHAFWAGTDVRTNFLCNLGYGDPAKIFPRHPKLKFDEVCEIL